uniref:DUF3699 domain-containing protein n=1 Tax=Panagrellus redivivus TaxID=6233 RepID=A0A7E4VWQ0_PANRE
MLSTCLNTRHLGTDALKVNITTACSPEDTKGLTTSANKDTENSKGTNMEFLFTTLDFIAIKSRDQSILPDAFKIDTKLSTSLVPRILTINVSSNYKKLKTIYFKKPLIETLNVTAEKQKPLSNPRRPLPAMTSDPELLQSSGQRFATQVNNASKKSAPITILDILQTDGILVSTIPK